MNFVDRIVRGDEIRKTRFHDEKGIFVGASGISNLPRAVWTYLVFRLVGRAPVLPWISYNAIERIDRALDADAHVLEFGSGMSTIWFARRATFVHSIEHDEGWYRKVSRLLEKNRITNVRYDLNSPHNYADVSEYDAPFFDFCLVDGIERLRCVERAIPLIKSGGLIYLDNSDVGEAERRKAVALITAAAEKAAREIDYFTDFAPTQLHANQGLLGRV